MKKTEIDSTIRQNERLIVNNRNLAFSHKKLELRLKRIRRKLLKIRREWIFNDDSAAQIDAILEEFKK